MEEERKQEMLRLVEHEMIVETGGCPATFRATAAAGPECDDRLSGKCDGGAALSEGSTSVVIYSPDTRGRLLCSARLAVMLIAVALTLATCSVWLCLDIRAMLRHEAQQVDEIKQMVATMADNKDVFSAAAGDRPFDEFSPDLAFDYDGNSHDDVEEDDELKSNEDSDSLYQDFSRDGGDSSKGDLEFVMDDPSSSSAFGDDYGSPSHQKKKPVSSNIPSTSSSQCDLVPESWRFDCHPESGATQQVCESRGCCWQGDQNGEVRKLGSQASFPYCFYPTGYGGYAYLNQTKTDTGFTLFLNQTRPAYYPESVGLLKMEVMFETKFRLRIKISDALNARYEVPVPVLPRVTSSAEDALYDINFYPDWGFQVYRKSSGEILFDASVGRLMYCNQFIQLSALLPSTYLYGLGEVRDSFLRSFDWQRFTLFNADHVPQEKLNLYGTHPFYLMMERSSSSHGVLLFNSNAMEIDLQPTPAITYRTIGGVLDFYFFLGPGPDEVVSQYTELIGRPFLPPYWGLGYHQCRFNYGTINETELVWQRTRDANIPFDVQWNDIDYMVKRRDFTVDKENFGDLARFVNKLHSVGMHYVPMVDCAIGIPSDTEKYEPYDEGKKANIFIKDSEGNDFVGKVWPGESVWPDFTNSEATIYWANQFQNFYSQVPIDGAWIDMNEPSNFYTGTEKGCPNSTWDNPPYVPGVIGNYLAHLTVCMSAQQNASRHYNVHNLYGFTEAIATNFALSSARWKRPFLISRSSFPGHGHYGGVWTGDVSSAWHDMRRSVSDILNFNLFGIPMVGADICGFNGNTTVKLCQRWMELGAFYPFARNHNTDDAIDQDPVALGPDVIKASQRALNTRYLLLPYLYTLFYKAHVYGSTVVRPLFFEFPSDRRTYTIDTQFLWGPALMVLPVLEEDVTTINAYIPKGLWYFGLNESINSAGSSYKINSPLDTIKVAQRGGHIIPIQGVNQTTTGSRLQPFGLYVALNETLQAVGDLFWDNGDSIGTIEKEEFNRLFFHANKNSVTSIVETFGYHGDVPMIMETVTIFGVGSKPSSVSLNGNDWTKFVYYDQFKVLEVYEMKVEMEKPFSLVWT